MNENDFSEWVRQLGDTHVAQTVIILRGVMFAAHRAMGKEREDAWHDATEDMIWLYGNPAFLAPPQRKSEVSE